MCFTDVQLLLEVMMSSGQHGRLVTDRPRVWLLLLLIFCLNRLSRIVWLKTKFKRKSLSCAASGSISLKCVQVLGEELLCASVG